MGIVFVGTAVGPMFFAVIAQRLLSTWGLRTAYTMLGLPILLVAVPLIAFNIRSRPPQAAPSSTVPQPAEFPGRTRYRRGGARAGRRGSL